VDLRQATDRVTAANHESNHGVGGLDPSTDPSPPLRGTHPSRSFHSLGAARTFPPMVPERMLSLSVHTVRLRRHPKAGQAVRSTTFPSPRIPLAHVQPYPPRLNPYLGADVRGCGRITLIVLEQSRRRRRFRLGHGFELLSKVNGGSAGNCVAEKNTVSNLRTCRQCEVLSNVSNCPWVS
jgi:hypothetical protein